MEARETSRWSSLARNGGSTSALDPESLKSVFCSLREWVRERDWRGFDPYDGLNSSVLGRTPLLNGKWRRIAVTQILKHCPVNLRGPLGVEPALNPKALALFLSGTVLARGVLDDLELRDDTDELAQLLEQTQSSECTGSGWGYNFPWQSREFFLPAGTPTIVVTSYAGNALLDLYERTGEVGHLQQARKAGRFILEDLYRSYDDEGEAFCWSYSPVDRTRVYNATLLGSRLLARLHHHTGDETLKETAKASVEYVVRRQDDRGAWIYGEASSQHWIDNFHTGFNLECLNDYQIYTGDEQYSEALMRGFQFYIDRLFEPSGAPRYYIDSLYPIDIHCCAQALITGAKLSRFDGAPELARRVLSWTLRHMRDPKGYFYFQKRRFYTHKVPFMRWSQAWLYLALATALRSFAGPTGTGPEHTNGSLDEQDAESGT